jgi:pimeloyl-ACP methyl ester carboxylesterase
VWLVGASQGGLIATLALERGPELYAGALAMCAPIGGFAAGDSMRRLPAGRSRPQRHRLAAG